jgi:hypothetical protein
MWHMKKIFLSLAVMAMVTGCGERVSVNPSDTKLITYIDGKSLYRLRIDRGTTHDTHFVYFFKSDVAQPITTNYKVGKNGHAVIISIDGVPMSTNILERLQ